MFYLPPREFWYLTVAHLAVSFSDKKAGTGTGFFVLDVERDQYYLVTARHVVDPSYSEKGKLRQAKCDKVTIGFSGVENPGTVKARSAYKILACTDPDFCYSSDDTDVAVMAFPRGYFPLRNGDITFRPASFPLEFIASQHELMLRYAGEPALFIGFPGNSPTREFGGHTLQYPILRQAVFAYPPVHGIPIEMQLGQDYGLLDSFAQSGFSGAPVVALQKGWADGSLHPPEEHRPPRVVGVVCGHYRSREDRADGSHSGLSFFARSTAIEDALKQAQQTTSGSASTKD